MSYRGRFAPSPTGSLHLGSLLAAVASFLDARANNGHWLIRIDDLDRFREVSGATTHILKTLEAFQLHWDGAIFYQSQQLDKYRSALECLQQKNLIYACNCSRKGLRRLYENKGIEAIYPGFCRDKQLKTSSDNYALRIKTADSITGHEDQIQGFFGHQLAQQVGDFIVRRRDQIHAYQLAVVIDDYSQDITHIVRGNDLLDSTPRQIYLQQLFKYPTPSYAHIPILVDDSGTKLSKQTGAKAIQPTNRSDCLFQVLDWLNHRPPEVMRHAPCIELLHWGIQNWQLKQLCGVKSIQLY